MDTKIIFNNRLKKYKKKKEKMQRKSYRLSNLRLLLFVLGLSLTIAAFLYSKDAYGYLVLLISTITFFYVVTKSIEANNEATRFSFLEEANKRCIDRIEGSWTSFIDDGIEFKDSNHPFTDDLDIFGSASLYQWLNNANTYYGRTTLKNILSNPTNEIKSIEKRQQAIKELSSKLDFCQHLQCEGMNGDLFENPEKLLKYTENDLKLIQNKFFIYVIYLLPIITIFLFLLWIFDLILLIFPLSLLIAQIVINIFNYGKIFKILEPVYSNKNKINAYQKIFKVIEEEKFNNDYLLKLKSKLYNRNKPASQQIKNLDKIVGAIALQYNPIVHFFINSLFFWDFRCVFSLEKWRDESGLALRDWILNIGMYEALSSLALTSQINPNWCYPKFDQNKLTILTEQIGHPLINEKQRVSNNLTIDNQILIITGSNMSGKTTLLRTIGINLVLAYAGSAVCAKNFKCSIMDIFTSMRLADDLNAGISTFYAELLRIKLIINHSKEEKPMIFLIDEVFRGTNSRDRIIGAKNVLINLNKDWVIGVISTHDYELCDFENDNSGRIMNYHFTETYKNGEIIFDYKLRKGRSKTTNAKYLMKMVGIEIKEENEN
ncbi:MutS-related protein, family 1 [Candidatus Syntrophocurvum alkaliphilum]|uniref:MutS-related protein, family 1 n=1 Tax=Candidatus Syntrophocurvum alkaliphilum TaxID=2293317 RepID=A0A6I6DFR7_9FIRM|nr:MutS family DNA mismatch repair protein [Candidatus Syntrophocurvum alkaliphilum]QGT99444.1 MutS-related protein, family 1 [Candidatus Syntrophocurvum alkaliphilum]